MVVERWQVIADPHTTKLARPDGAVVTVFRLAPWPSVVGLIMLAY